MADKQNNHSNSGGHARRRRKRTRRAGASVVHPSLVTALGMIPESRAEMVVRARRLARDPNYPSAETLRLISEMLAAHLEFDGFSY
jgi:hypothetical protein